MRREYLLLAFMAGMLFYGFIQSGSAFALFTVFCIMLAALAALSSRSSGGSRKGGRRR